MSIFQYECPYGHSYFLQHIRFLAAPPSGTIRPLFKTHSRCSPIGVEPLQKIGAFLSPWAVAHAKSML